ncbi:MAG: hypothetical protein JWM18_2136 [Chloroflexi bacterium]|jgi:hypothetical protein|nr:hypothetical protein [Chloroflexota bacterium]MEA2501737.1 hypothetical protein [Actinomycetota bacterium]
MLEPLALVGKLVGLIFGAGVVFALVIVILVVMAVRGAQSRR